MRVAVPHTFEGRRFEITPMGAFRGLAVMERVAKVLGPAVGRLAAGGKGGTDVLDALASGVAGLADRLDGSTFEWLCRELAADTLCQTEAGGMVPLAGVFDLYFAGRYPLLLAWAKAALEVNFGPLGDALNGLGLGRAGSAAGAPASP